MTDIFGVTPQALQGADLLAQTEGIRVILPDVLEGWIADGSLFSEPKTDEKCDPMARGSTSSLLS